MRLISIALGTAVAAAALIPAWAGNNLVTGEFKIDEPTLHSLGFRWLVEGDDNRNARADLWWRVSEEDPWQSGHPLLRINGEPAGRDGWICGNLFAGSLLGLQPGTAYQVRIVLTDPEGVTGTSEQAASVATRRIPPSLPGSRTLHVYPSCSAPGVLQPCYTDIGAAGRAANPGEVVLIHAGTYLRTTVIDLSSLAGKATSETAPITIRGEGRGVTIIDGGVGPGGSGSELFWLVGTKHLTFERFTVKNAATAFYGRDATGLTIRDIRMEGVHSGVLGGYTPKAKDRNWTITDNEVTGWNTTWYPYSDQSNSKSHTGIRVYGKGHAVENNTVGKFWDCIAHSDTGGGQVTNATVDWRNPPSLNIDIGGNDLYECYDDALSADYNFHNIRFTDNRMTNAHTALSAQPLYGGPAYFIRNTGFNMAANSFKFHNQPAGVEAYHNTMAVHDFAWECDAGWPNARIVNNLLLGNPSTSSIAVGSGTPAHPLTRIDYNGYTGTQGSNLIQWNRAPYGGNDRRNYASLAAFYAGEGHEQHGRLVTYSLFNDAFFPGGEGYTYPNDEVDFGLRPAAAARDAALRLPGINDSFEGSAPDLGALEFGEPVPLYGPRLPGEAADPEGPGTPLSLRREGSGYRLAWSAPADGGPVFRYSLYSTPLGQAFAGECAADLGSGTTALLASLPANRGFVVVARNDRGEGSPGRDAQGLPRQPPAAPCP